MTDVLSPETPDEADTKGIQVDRYGDPLPQGTRMLERESYERIIEGLKLSADACMHMIVQEPEKTGKWRGISLRLDQCRRICIQHAGIDDVIRARQTEEVRGEAMRWRDARTRLREGLVQAAGGARQLAVCFRMDFMWSTIATELETMERNIKTPRAIRNMWPPHAGLILPAGYTRH